MLWLVFLRPSSVTNESSLSGALLRDYDAPRLLRAEAGAAGAAGAAGIFVGYRLKYRSRSSLPRLTRLVGLGQRPS
jgi:hypothetical protein